MGGRKRTENERKSCVREKMMGIALLKTGKITYKKLVQVIRDQNAFCIDVYPNNYTTLTSCWKATSQPKKELTKAAIFHAGTKM